MGATGGNVFTYGEAGILLRVGQDLAADYGPPHIRPSISGTWFDADRIQGLLGWHLFVGTRGRAVARNIFLDGNIWESSRSVDKKPLVADLLAGASLFWTDLPQLEFTVAERAKEFCGQRGEDRFGMVTLSFRFW